MWLDVGVGPKGKEVVAAGGVPPERETDLPSSGRRAVRPSVRCGEMNTPFLSFHGVFLEVAVYKGVKRAGCRQPCGGDSYKRLESGRERHHSIV